MGNHLKNFLLTILNPKIEEIFIICSDSLSQSIGRGRISREEALDVRESRERRDKNFAENIENAKILDQKQQFSAGNFHFSAAEQLTFEGGYITSKLARQ